MFNLPTGRQLPGKSVIVILCKHNQASADLAHVRHTLDAFGLAKARERVGNSMLARMPIIAITTSNSIKVKAWRRRECV